VDDWKSPLAPPTDYELKQRGLGFFPPPSPSYRGQDGEIVVPQSPRPPDIVAAELDAYMTAYKKGLTPRRKEIVPPNEVLIAVDMARAAAANTDSSNLNQTKNIIDIDSSRRPAPLVLPSSPNISIKRTSPTNYVPDKSQQAPPKPIRSTNNGYSMGNSIPDGVRWRYVDVLNSAQSDQPVYNSSQIPPPVSKKRSPSKQSPKHRVSTISAITSSKSSSGTSYSNSDSGGMKYGSVSTGSYPVRKASV
jgi:hypothetical protein